MDTANDPQPRSSEWRKRLLVAVSGMLLFETLTGLSVYVLPFSVPNQLMVMLHTAVGLAIVVPLVWYSVRHWYRYSGQRLTHVKLTGYFAAGILLALVVSGLLLTYQAMFSSRISYGWDLVHVVATFALIAATLPHVLAKVYHAYRGENEEALRVRAAVRRYGWETAGVSALLFLLIVVGTAAYPPIDLNDEFPADYSYLFGDDRPFAPSLARTSTGGAFDARALGGSETCGSASCHEDIAREWAVSAHRYSAMDPAFQAVQKVMAEQNGAESTRYCGGCHDPISLFSGAKNVFAEDLTNLTGYQEGVSCLVCHAIKETDVEGNADYVITQPDRYMFELHEGGATKWISDFLIRSYPRQHVTTLQHRLFKSPEFCAACHKQYIDEEINQVGWVQLQNQFDNWRKSRWNEPGDPTRTIECRECHMPLTDSSDPARGDDLDYNRSNGDGKHRSHRFLGANQFVPALLELPGSEEHVKLTREWLRGEIEIPEIADKWREGPAVPVELSVPASATPGEEVRIGAVVTNNKVGHEFPTGPLDIIQAWLEVRVTDDRGNLLYESGRREESGFIQEGSFIFKAEPVDQYGNLIDRHNLWEMVGVRYRRAVFPGFSDQTEFAFLCPSSASEPGIIPDEEFVFQAPGQVGLLHVSVKLMYRKVDQFLLNFLFGEQAGVTSPVAVLSEDEKVIPVIGTG